MISLSGETEALARRLAAARCLPVDDAVRQALETEARIAGVLVETRSQRRRLSVEQILAVGDEIVEMPLLDPRSPREIMDDIDEL